MRTDGATIISICPFPLDEFKPGLIPSVFHVDAAKENDIAILNIGYGIKARMRVPVIGNTIDMDVPPATIAKAIVEDRLSGQLYYGPEAKPGLFYVEGTYSKEECKVTFSSEISEANKIQKNWFLNLVKMADDDWAKSKQHRYISDLQRHAARALGLTKDWNFDVSNASDARCVACFSQIHPLAAICPVCRTNQAEFRAISPVVVEPVKTAPVIPKTKV